MLSGQSPFLQALGWAVLNSLWQMALLWLVYLAVTRLTPTLKPGRRAALATSGLFTGFAWFLVTFFSGLLSSTDYGFVISSNSGIPVQEQLNEFVPYASIAYLFLLIFPLRHFIRNFRYVNWIRHHGLSKIGVNWRIFTRNTAEQMGIQKKVTIWISELVSSPVTIGYLKPVILIPIAAVSQLSPAMMEAVILHELSHIRRFDYLLNLITRFIRSVLYFNPFVSCFIRVTEQEREKDCDDMVLQFRYDAAGYATALLLLEKANRQSAPLAMPATGRGHELLHRVERILGVHRHPGMFNYRRIAGVLAGMICLFGLNILLRLTVPYTGTLTASRFVSRFRAQSGPIASNDLPERNQATLINHPATEPASPKNAIETSPFPDIPGLVRASILQNVKPELARAQELQVEKALQDSRRVLENLQWKVAEKKMADVFTQEEKSVLKKKYMEQVSKFNWNKWEDKLKTAYNEVDWDRINSQLDAAINHIRIDSLQNVYNLAASRLDEASQYMQQEQAKGIPDTDITLKEVEKKKKEVEKMLKELKLIRNKKIVHL